MAPNRLIWGLFCTFSLKEENLGYTKNEAGFILFIVETDKYFFERGEGNSRIFTRVPPQNQRVLTEVLTKKRVFNFRPLIP